MRKGKKKNVMIYLDPKVVKEARELGLNISRISENALKEAIRRLKGVDCPNILNSQTSDDFSSEKSYLAGPPGLEPGSSCLLFI